jgi:hypothetical protein
MANRDSKAFPRRTAFAAAMLGVFGNGAAFAASGDALGPPQASGLDNPALARSAGGDFVAATGTSVRLFNADGTPKGAVFSASDTPVDSALAQPNAVAMDDAGDFVVAWLDDSIAGDSSSHSVFARRFNADGSAKGAAVQVSDALSNEVRDIGVGMDSDGDFVVLWHQAELNRHSKHCYGYNPLCAGVGVQGASLLARRYTAGGTKAGSSIVVEAGRQYDLFGVNLRVTVPNDAQVAMNRKGAFAVAWTGASGSLLQLRRWSASGIASPSHVVSLKASTGCVPQVAMDDAGGMVVAYCHTPTASVAYVYTRVYSAAGLPLTGETQVAGSSSVWSQWPGVSMDAGGDFVVAWHNRDSSVHAQRYANGVGALGMDFTVAAAPTAVYIPGIASDGSGNFVIAWDTWLQRYAGP